MELKELFQHVNTFPKPCAHHMQQLHESVVLNDSSPAKISLSNLYTNNWKEYLLFWVLVIVVLGSFSSLMLVIQTDEKADWRFHEKILKSV